MTISAPRQEKHGFTDVSFEEALRRCRELVPVLRSRAAEAEVGRQLMKNTEDDLHRSGLLRFGQPKRFGGMELDFNACFDLPAELARGDASSGWNLANLGVHHWMLALYDERAQEEVWGGNPDALIASGIAFPQGSGRRIDGGYLINGYWNFSSGVDASTWNMLAVTVRDGDRVIDHRMCLVPAGEYEIVDDWHVLGMKATGSKSVRAKDLFVPDYRALCMYDIRGGANFPGAKIHSNPTYRIPLVALGSHGIAGSAVGNAQAAVDLTIEIVKERSTSYTAMRMRDFQAVQLRVANASTKVHAARLICRNDCLEAQKDAVAGRIPSIEEKLRVRRNVAWAINQCTEAVDALHAMAGANGIYDRYPIQRIFRDAHALGGHIGFSWDAQGSPWGLVAMGGEFISPTL
ncbi:MAG: acyl-CoA dehydrogenase [Betaproteobacteria bacterium]|nr:acyl-CoA dehydrogenase [Betaproteobacteria bacterium]